MSIWSSMTGRLEDVQNQLNDMKRKFKFRKANKSRQQAAELQYSLLDCAGKLEVCKKDFNRTIQQQSRNIIAGEQDGMDTHINEQILWDAALGYMLVKDASFALGTVPEYDSIAHAYELLEAATRQIANRGSNPFRLTGRLPGKERDEYGYLSAESTLNEKENVLNDIFDDLKKTGNIEECLKNRRSSEKVTADRRSQYTEKTIAKGSAQSKRDDIDARFNSIPDDASVLDDMGDDLDAMKDIYPPEDDD